MIDILFVAWNRLEFTKESLDTLIANTDWRLVRNLIVHDDGSTDGTAEWLRNYSPLHYYKQALGCEEVVIRHGQLGSPTGVMNQYLREPGQTFLAKIDNDAMMPPGWLNEAIAVMESHPELNLLGLGAWMPVGPAPRTYEPCKAIGGIGLMRSSAFECCLPWEGGRYGGAQMWQSDHMQEPIVLTGPITEERKVNPPHRVSQSGWISPGIPVFLLDMIPFEPWASFSAQYIEKGWQRRWTTHPETDSHLWSWWKESCVA